MLSFGGEASFLPGGFQCLKRKNLNIHSIGKSGRGGIIDVIVPAPQKKFYHRVNYGMINERAVAGETDYGRRSRIRRRPIVTIQNVILASSVNLYAKFFTERG